MPREYTFGCEPIVMERQGPHDDRPLTQYRAEEDGHPMVISKEGMVSVGWSAEAEHVQVTTLTRDTVSRDTDIEGPYIALDRRGINELIRNLRRARDQAFGRDE